jgi:hypothetical protein
MTEYDNSVLQWYHTGGIIAEYRSDDVIMGRVLEIITFFDVFFRQLLLSAETANLIFGIPPERTVKSKGNEGVRS